MGREDKDTGRTTISVSLVEAFAADAYRYGLPEGVVDEWYRLTWDLGLWFKERGYDVSVTGFGVSLNGGNATLNVSKEAR